MRRAACVAGQLEVAVHRGGAHLTMQASPRIRALSCVIAAAGLAACVDVDGLTYDLGASGGGGPSSSSSSGDATTSSTTATGAGGAGGDSGSGGAGGTGPRTYFDVVMEDEPAGYWRFDADSQLVADVSGNGHDAVAFAEETNGGFVTRAVAGALAGDADRALYLGGTRRDPRRYSLRAGGKKLARYKCHATGHPVGKFFAQRRPTGLPDWPLP